MNFLTKILQPFRTRAAEGAVRPGPWNLPVTGGWLDANVGSSWNWWQNGGNISYYQPSALVEACVQAYAQTVAMCPGTHWLLESDEQGRERIDTSSLARVLKKPNAYQSISDFLLDATTDLYTMGNAYALALRNARYEITELHLMEPRNSFPRVSVEGDVFYALGGNDVIDYQLKTYPLLVPARDVLHIRLHTTPWKMLLGESPLIAAARDIAAGDAILQQQISFYMNQARPSTVLATDMVLDKDQVAALRDRWNEQSRGLNAGGTPILTAGIKPIPLATTAHDSQLADVMKMSKENIALAFRVPLQILGIGGSPYGNTEVLMQSWLAMGLGFCLNHIEEAFGNLFQLKGYPDEYVEFDTSALLRSEMKNRIEAFARGVQGGIYAPNEARADFGLPKVSYGDEPRVQQQLVPLSAASGIPSAPGAPSAPSQPAQPARPIPQPTQKDFSYEREPDFDIPRCADDLIVCSDEIDRRSLS
jgi:HK97 family phage portal protein